MRSWSSSMRNLQSKRALTCGREHGFEGESLGDPSVQPKRLKPASARTIASYSLHPIFECGYRGCRESPSESNRAASISIEQFVLVIRCQFSIGAEVPLAQGFAERGWHLGMEHGEGRLPERDRPSVLVGRSFKLCTAKSQRRSNIATWISLVKSPCPHLATMIRSPHRQSW